MFRAKADACTRGGWCTYFCEFEYRTAKSWSRAQRVVGKAQVNPQGENPRFIVTNLPGERREWMPEKLYREFYCARSYKLLRARRHGIERSEMDRSGATCPQGGGGGHHQNRIKESKTYAKATPGVIRNHLLKIAAVVKVSVRRVLVRWSSSFRLQKTISTAADLVSRRPPATYRRIADGGMRNAG